MGSRSPNGKGIIGYEPGFVFPKEETRHRIPLYRGTQVEDMTIIITDDDVKRLLPMRDCIEAMRVAFGDLADGAAVNRPRMRYLARHPDPERKYLANVHVGAVPSYGIACVRAGSQVIRPPSAANDRRLYENPRAS